MRIEVMRQNCPNFSVEVSDCALCVRKYLAAANLDKPCCFRTFEDDGTDDVMVWIKNGDFFLSPAVEQAHPVFSTDCRF